MTRENQERSLFSLQQVVTSAQSGNQEAQKALAEHVMVRFTPYYLMRRPHDCEDLTLELAASVLASITRFNPLKGRGNFESNFYAWTSRIARNRYVDSIRRERKTVRSTREVLNPQASESIELPVISLLVEKLSSILTPSEAKIVSHMLHGAEYNSLPERLSTTTGSIFAMTARARRK